MYHTWEEKLVKALTILAVICLIMAGIKGIFGNGSFSVHSGVITKKEYSPEWLMDAGSGTLVPIQEEYHLVIENGNDWRRIKVSREYFNIVSQGQTVTVE